MYLRRDVLNCRNLDVIEPSQLLEEIPEVVQCHQSLKGCFQARPCSRQRLPPGHDLKEEIADIQNGDDVKKEV